MADMSAIIGGFVRSCLFAIIFEIAGRPRKEGDNMSARKRKRLNMDDRSNIVGYLAMGMTVPEIAERMTWSPSTIYREIARIPPAEGRRGRGEMPLEAEKASCLQPMSKARILQA